MGLIEAEDVKAPLTKEPAPPKVLTAKDKNFWPAVGAAFVDQARAKWKPGTDERGRPEPGHCAFTRAEVQVLHDCGSSRKQVLDYARQVYNDTQLATFATDLDSYGKWQPE